MQQLARQRGGKCLSIEYINNKTNLKWECRAGHQWNARPDNVLNLKSWCKKCEGLEKGTIEQMQELAKQKGGKCVSEVYVNQKTKLLFDCGKGHPPFLKAPDKIKRGQWCPECSGKKPKTIDDINRFAEERGWKFLSENFTNVNTKHKWQCNKGHIIEKPYNSIQQGHGCRECAGKAELTIEKINDFVNEKWKGKCLSKKYLGQHKKLLFQCAKGHQFKKYVNNVINQEHWCTKYPKCFGFRKWTIKNIQRKAKKIGWKLLPNQKYINGKGHLNFICENGHEINKRVGDFINGSGCPNCKYYRTESKCKGILEYLLNTKFPKNFRKKVKGELDGYSEKLNFAFEYHGEQHYKDVFRFNQKYSLEERQRKDKEKELECDEKGIRLMIIPYYEAKKKENLLSFIKNELNKLNIQLERNPEVFPWEKLGGNVSILKELNKFASKKGWECISKVYWNSSKKLLWRCKKAGHIWKATPLSIKFDRKYCPDCKN